jgi:hypothetical protein
LITCLLAVPAYGRRVGEGAQSVIRALETFGPNCLIVVVVAVDGSRLPTVLKSDGAFT